MLTICIFAALLLPHDNSFGQVKDSIALANHIPIRCGFILTVSSSSFHSNICPGDGIYVYNHLESDSAYSITDGTVSNIIKLEEDIFCLIRSGSKNISYGPFKYSPLKDGDMIKRGDYLGAMIDSDFEDGKYNLLVMVYKRKKYFSFKQYVAWINKQY